MSDPAALRATGEVSDQVCAELLRLPDEVSAKVAAGVALAMVEGAARAYRQMVGLEGGGAAVDTQLGAAIALERAQ